MKSKVYFIFLAFLVVASGIFIQSCADNTNYGVSSEVTITGAGN